MAKIPVRYIGDETLLLSSAGAPYYDMFGNRLTSLFLYPGDTLMMEDQEILGMTHRIDPWGFGSAYCLGCGHVVELGDENLTDDELEAMGYQFNAGRSDFISLQPFMNVRGRFPIMSADQLVDTASRFGLAIIEDTVSRFLLMSADQLVDTASRFGLALGTNLADTMTVLNLALIEDTASRFLLMSEDVLADTTNRFLLMSEDLLADTATRFVLDV